MNYIKELDRQTDLVSLASDLSALLAMTSNADISEEFPASVARYTGDPRVVQENLAETIDDCTPGVRQQFIAFSGLKAVGMSVIRFTDKVPAGVDEAWPNVSGFICHPFRAQGLGALSLQTRLKVVERKFGGNAWTQVKKNNVASNRMVIHAGFKPVSETDNHTVFAYHV